MAERSSILHRALSRPSVGRKLMLIWLHWQPRIAAASGALAGVEGLMH